MRAALHAGMAFLMLIACISIANAERRVALVIGNSAYAKVEKLKNPANDAKRLSESLKAIGFDKVTLKLDLSQGDLRRTLGQFSRDAAGADIALIYFAGHGIEVGGTNYIIPTDAKLSHVDDVEFEALPLRTMLSALNRAGKLKLVILDACRNNPFKDKMASTGSNRSIGRGLARVSPSGSDTLVAYAAKEGTVADDGAGENSPYAEALIKHITTPGIDVRLLFGRVRDDVLKSTGRRQEPFTYGSLGGTSIYLKAPQASTAPTIATNQDTTNKPAKKKLNVDKETVFWSSVKDSNDPAMFQEYLTRFPQGTFAGLAALRIKALKSKLALATPSKMASQRVLAVHECDRLAASPADENKVTSGVPKSEIRAEKAINSCRQALKTFPNTARFESQLGRALEAQKDYTGAAEQYRKAAEKHYATAAVYLGHLHQNGNGVRQDMAEAVRLFRKGAELGNEIAMVNLVSAYHAGQGVKKNYIEAVRWSRKAAEKGNSLGMEMLGYAYQYGQGLPKDRTESIRWYRKSAKGGNESAMRRLGDAYDTGSGVRQDFVESFRWYRKAAEKGNALAMAKLGAAYSLGRGVKKNDAEAVRWHRKAADKGDARAMANLGLRYYQGRGVSKNQVEAIKLIKKAAAKKDAYSLYLLGRFRHDGTGVSHDLQKAAELVFQAVKAGNEFAKKQMLTNSSKWSPRFRRLFQQQLSASGAYTGPIDGSFGPTTKAAIRKLAAGS